MRLDPLSLPNNAEVVRTMYYARDYDGALAQAQKAMQLDPSYYRIHFWLGRVYAQKGMHQQAVDESEFSKRPRIAHLGLQSWLIVLPPRGGQPMRGRFSAPSRNDPDRVGFPLTISRSFMLH
jgi:TPR repeat